MPCDQDAVSRWKGGAGHTKGQRPGVQAEDGGDGPAALQGQVSGRGRQHRKWGLCLRSSDECWGRIPEFLGRLSTPRWRRRSACPWGGAGCGCELGFWGTGRSVWTPPHLRPAPAQSGLRRQEAAVPAGAGRSSHGLTFHTRTRKHLPAAASRARLGVSDQTRLHRAKFTQHNISIFFSIYLWF